MLQQTGPAVGRAFNNRDLATGLSIHVSLLEGPVLQNVKYWHFLSCKCTNKINKSQYLQKFTLFSRKFSNALRMPLHLCVWYSLYISVFATTDRDAKTRPATVLWRPNLRSWLLCCRERMQEAKPRGEWSETARLCRSFPLTSPLICGFACLVLNPPLFYSARPTCIGSRGLSECFTL